MPRYRGWNLDEMTTKRSLPDSGTDTSQKRRSRAHLSLEPESDRLLRKPEADRPDPNSFTPIDAVKPSYTAETYYEAESSAMHSVSGSGQGTAHRRNNGARNPIIAAYLGLGEVPPGSAGIESIISVTNSSTRAAENYNNTSMSEVLRKRKQTTQKKNHKSNVMRAVSDGMRISKPEIADASERCSGRGAQRSPSNNMTSPRIGDSSGLGLISKTTKNKLDAFRYEAGPCSIAEQRDPSSSAAAEKDRVSVVAPLTSLDALRAQRGFGCTLYQGAVQALDANTGGVYLSKLSEKPHMNEPVVQPETAAPADGDCHPNSSAQSFHGPLTALPTVESRNGTTSARDPAQGPKGKLDELSGVSQMSVTCNTEHTYLERLLGPSTDKQRQIDSVDELLNLHDDDLADEDLLDTVLDADLYNTAGTNDSHAVIAQLLTPLPSDPLTNMCHPSQNVAGNGVIISQDELEYDWEVLNDDELVVMDPTDDVFDSFQTSSQRLDAGDTAVSPESGSATARVDPDQTALASGACSVSNNYGQHLRPIVRPAFPQQIHDRSSVVGLSASMVLRTCFRVGEAVNVACQAARAGRTVIIELYARVSSSWREQAGVKQHFVFADLFHNRPPFINGIYECWKGVELWNYDSQRFLERGNTERMCRCIGKMKREGNKWRLAVLNIWEASWDDINHVKGIVCS